MADYLLFVLFLNVILLTKSWPERRPNYEHEIGQDSSALDDDIPFPDIYTTKLRFSISKEAADFSASGKGLNCVANVCDDAKEYPYEHINDVIGKIKAYNKLFGFLEGSVVTLTNRFKRAAEEDQETLCPTITHTTYPKTLKNENSTEKFIVNVDGYKQSLVFETCAEEAKCKFPIIFPTTHTSQCSQRYTKRRLMALGEDGNPTFDTFLVPSCCVCTIKKVTERK